MVESQIMSIEMTITNIINARKVNREKKRPNSENGSNSQEELEAEVKRKTAQKCCNEKIVFLNGKLKSHRDKLRFLKEELQKLVSLDVRLFQFKIGEY